MKLKAVNREITGKATRRLRREGRLPAVLYGQRAASVSLELDMHEFERMYARAGKTQLIDLTVESGRPHKVLVKEVQRSPRRNTVLHVDFHQVSLRERLQVDVPISVSGEVDPAQAGDADVIQVLNVLRVECLPASIPEVIEVNVSGLTESNPTIRVADIELPQGVDAVADADDVIVRLAARRAAVEEEEAPVEEGAAAGAAEGETPPEES
jgi:large subunit ribosomal protein L25